MIEQTQNSQSIQEAIDGFHHKLSVIDSNNVSIEKLSTDFIETTTQLPTIVNDLLSLWGRFSKERPNKIPFIKLANEIVQKSFAMKQTNPQMELHDIFYQHIFDVFPFLYSLLDPIIQNEIETTLVQWETIGIYTNEQIKEIRFLLKLYTDPEFDGRQIKNQILFKLILDGQIKLDETLCEYSREIDLMNGSNDNKHRENVLKITKDIINKQNKIYYTHLHYVQVLDKMLDKIKTYKEFNRSLIESQNSNIK